MNREFKIIGNKVVVFTDDKGRLHKDVTNNIEDILICENNIEEMEESLQNNLDKIKQSKKKIRSSWSDFGLSALWLTCFILNSISGNWFPAGCNILCSVLWFTIGYFEKARHELKFIKASKTVIKELEDNLKTEKEKLYKLNQDKTNDLMYISPSKKAIDRSEQIRNLKRKLDVIYSFEIHKQKLIRHYKKGILKEMMKKYFYLNYYDDNDYSLLEELIKNELSKKEEKKIGNQKVLKRS